ARDEELRKRQEPQRVENRSWSSRDACTTKPANVARAPAAEEMPITAATPPLLLEMTETKLGYKSERLFKLELNASTYGVALAWRWHGTW
ncbi:hypothetical protein THAOC_08810, partial [Thalassiosira oceanica]